MAADTLSTKNPRNEPSLHCRSGLSARRPVLRTFAAAGAMLVPNAEGELTAVPANSTPSAPRPLAGSYVFVSFGTARASVSGEDGHGTGRTGEVGDPVGVRVAREDDDVVNLVGRYVLEDALPIRAVAVPCVEVDFPNARQPLGGGEWGTHRMCPRAVA